MIKSKVYTIENNDEKQHIKVEIEELDGVTEEIFGELTALCKATVNGMINNFIEKKPDAKSDRNLLFIMSMNSLIERMQSSVDERFRKEMRDYGCKHYKNCDDYEYCKGCKYSGDCEDCVNLEICSCYKRITAGNDTKSK